MLKLSVVDAQRRNEQRGLSSKGFVTEWAQISLHLRHFQKHHSIMYLSGSNIAGRSTMPGYQGNPQQLDNLEMRQDLMDHESYQII